MKLLDFTDNWRYCCPVMKTELTDIKYCLYARKSSEQDERQAMSIDSQIKLIKNIESVFVI